MNVSEFYNKACELHSNNGWAAGGWSSWEHQYAVFSSITAFHDGQGSILDVGCGQGDLLDSLRIRFNGKVEFQYTGLDISKKMIDHARKNHKWSEAKWLCEDLLGFNYTHDFVVGAGTFNVRISDDDEKQYEYLRKHLVKMYDLANRVVSLSVLSNQLLPEEGLMPEEGTVQSAKAMDVLYQYDPAKVLDISLSITPNVILDHTSLIAQCAVYLYK